MSIKTAIIEDDKEVREGISALINSSERLICTGAYYSAEEALENINNITADVYLIDINLPGMNGINCVKKLKELKPGIQVLMLTVYENNEQVVNSIFAGANGYLLKTTPPQKLLEAIEDVYNGGAPMSSQIARKVVNAFASMGKSNNSTEDLTPREEEILSLLAKGYRYREIAVKLYISIETVRKHIHNIYEKIHVRSRTEAVLKYFNKKDYMP